MTIPHADSNRQVSTISYQGRYYRDDSGKFWYVFADVYETLHLEVLLDAGLDGLILFGDLPDEHKLSWEDQGVLLIDKDAFVQLAIQMGTIPLVWAVYLFFAETHYDQSSQPKPTWPKRKNWRENSQIRNRFIRQKGLCYYCHEPLLDGWVVEHVKPISKGGEDELHNLVIACTSCNTKKGNKSPHEWPDGGRLC